MSGGGIKSLIAPAVGLGASFLLPELAPEFMAGLTDSLGATGASALIGAGTGGVSSAITGGNPLMGALTGGAGGAAGGYLSGLMGPDIPTPGAEVASDVATATAPGGASQYAADLAARGGGGVDSIAQGLTGNPTVGAPIVPASASAAAPASDGIGNWIGQHPAQAIGIGAGLLGAIQQPGMNPVNVGGNAASVLSTNPGFSASLPKYNYNNVKTPYTGNWYTYGQQPQQPMVQNTVTPMARGGLMRRYADGGDVIPLPQRKPSVIPLGVPPMRQLTVDDVVAALPKGVLGAGIRHNPTPLEIMQSAVGGDFLDHSRGGLMGYAKGGKTHHHAHARLAARALGRAVGQQLQARQNLPIFAGQGEVSGPGGGQDDAVPAMLSNSEFVVPADVVSHLGDGSSEAGGRKLTGMIHNVRKHKATKGFPPKAKANPLAYARV